MLKLLRSQGITLPLVSIIWLYAMGISYHAAKLRTWGFVQYTGDINFNDIIYLNFDSLLFLQQAIINFLAFYWTHLKHKSTMEILIEPNKEVKERLISNAGHEFVESKRETRAFWLAGTWTFGLVTYQIFTANWFWLFTIVAGTVVGLILWWSVSVKNYSFKLFLIWIAILASMAQSQYCGFTHAKKHRPQIAVIKTNSELIFGFYYFEDAKSIYIFENKNPMKISKDAIINWQRIVKWPENSFGVDDPNLPKILLEEWKELEADSPKN